MRFPKYLLTLAVSVGLTGNAMAVEKYAIDRVHSNVGFAVKHLMVSTVRGHFTDFSGEIMLDPADITKSSVTVTIKTASIDTENEQRNNHLRSADFFDAVTYPEITFTSSRIEKQGDGYVAHGTLTMRGVSKEVALPFTLTGPMQGMRGKVLGVDATMTLNRQDYGIAYNRTLDTGGVVVGNEVKVELNIEAGEVKQ
jgi:polyisoprenoid-binding protein YceI